MARYNRKQQKREQATSGGRLGRVRQKYVGHIGLTGLALLISRHHPEEDLLPAGEAVQVEAELNLVSWWERIQGTVTAGEVRAIDSRYV